MDDEVLIRFITELGRVDGLQEDVNTGQRETKTDFEPDSCGDFDVCVRTCGEVGGGSQYIFPTWPGTLKTSTENLRKLCTSAAGVSGLRRP